MPIDDVDRIIISNHTFCFTGQFLYGSREDCHRAVQKRGGVYLKNVESVLDYLVIGSMVKGDWAHTSHARKIEKVMKYKKQSRNVHIISEEQWAKHL